MIKIENVMPAMYVITVKKKRKLTSARHQWLPPVILATQETEIRKITVRSQPRQIVHETLSQKNPS
jgi:hypothetical protein